VWNSLLVFWRMLLATLRFVFNVCMLLIHLLMRVCVGQGIGRWWIGRPSHSSQPSTQATPPYISCPWSYWTYVYPNSLLQHGRRLFLF
jgi:hypothetical protein